MFGDAQREVFDCRDPATGELLGEVPAMGEADVLASIHRARFVQPDWELRPLTARIAVLRGVLRRIVGTQDELCRIAAHDSGETMLDAMAHEVLPLCRDLHALIAAAADSASVSRMRLWSRGSGVAAPTWAQQTPGVVGLFAPGYLPLRSLVLPVTRTLLGGNAAVIKVSSRVAWSSTVFAEMIRDLLAEHGHPRDLLQVITGDVDSGEALANAGCDRLEFTGTERTSRAVVAAAALSQTPVRLALDVCRPVIIDKTDDPQAALQPAARRIFGGAGQLRGGAPLVYVHTRHYGRFLEAATSLVQRLRFGSPLRDDVDCGPLITASRSGELTRLLDNAERHGATVYAGGHPRDRHGGSFFEPTLVGPVAPPMELCEGRILGPVMALRRFEHAHELPGVPSEPRSPASHRRDLQRALQALPLYPARSSTFALLESLVRARYGNGSRHRARALLAASRYGLTELRARTRPSRHHPPNDDDA